MNDFTIYRSPDSYQFVLAIKPFIVTAQWAVQHNLTYFVNNNKTLQLYKQLYEVQTEGLSRPVCLKSEEIVLICSTRSEKWSLINFFQIHPATLNFPKHYLV